MENMKKDLSILALALLLAFLIDFGPYLTATGFFGASVTIIVPPFGMFRENQTSSLAFAMNISGEGWLYYNESFYVNNPSNQVIDVYIAAPDIPMLNSSSYINTAKYGGEFQIYINETGNWYNIPDMSTDDSDSTKDSSYLCIAKNVIPAQNVTDFNFRVNATDSGPYALYVTVFSLDILNRKICYNVGEYYEIE